VSDKRWKRRERQVAKVFGGKRVGPAGFNTADVTHPLLSISVKSRKALPAWAMACLEEARGFRDSNGKAPAVILIGKGMRIRDGILVMRLGDFEQLHGAISQGAEGEGER
jgi:hypothetical protein